MVLQNIGPDPNEAGRALYVLRESPDGPIVQHRDISFFDAVMDLPAYKAAVAKMTTPTVTLHHDTKASYTLHLSVLQTRNAPDDLIDLAESIRAISLRVQTEVHRPRGRG